METMHKALSSFKWQQLIEFPQEITSASFIEGDDALTFFDEYRKLADYDYGSNLALNVLSIDDDKAVIAGSNPFAVVLANKILKKEGIRTATQADLEQILAVGADLQLRGHYEDTALVYRDEQEPNSYIASVMAKQLNSRGINKSPVMLPLYQLELVKDSNSPHGLAFHLSDNCHPIYAEQLSHKNNGRRFSSADENGLPIFDKAGNRQLYTIEHGLSRLCLYGGLNASSSYDPLAYSDAGGRVVLVRSEAADKNLLERYKKDLMLRYEESQKKLSEKFERALKLLDS